MVSILIPTYNQSRYLLQAVESALNQDYAHLEVIVCDDASSDWDQGLLKTFVADPRLRIHRNPHNLGRVKNYRQCLYELAKLDWVLVLDGDDFLLDHAYVRMLSDSTKTKAVLLCRVTKTKTCLK